MLLPLPTVQAEETALKISMLVIALMDILEIIVNRQHVEISTRLTPLLFVLVEVVAQDSILVHVEMGTQEITVKYQYVSENLI